MSTGQRSMKLILVLLTLLIGPASVWGTITTGTWFMDQSNTFPEKINYGWVSIQADSDKGTVQFTVEASKECKPYGEPTNFGIQAFGFNYLTTVLPDSTTWTVKDLPNNWKQDSGQFDGFGNFQVQESGKGNSRVERLSFTITLPNGYQKQAIASNFAVLSSGNNGQDKVYFSAHIAGFKNNPGSHYVGGYTVATSVPEPATLSLLILGSLTLLHRRKP